MDLVFLYIQRYLLYHYMQTQLVISRSETYPFAAFKTFLAKVFDPQVAKAFILISSGLTNSGKSFAFKCISNIWHQMNGVSIGSELNADFVRVSDLETRMLRCVEEYKGNIIDQFHHLEANGKQLRKNNAYIDSRINLTILNCDQANFSLVNEANRSQFSKTDHERLSRRQQVASRSYILNWSDPHWKFMKELSLLLCAIQ